MSQSQFRPPLAVICNFQRSDELVARGGGSNGMHHLWCNHGIWSIGYTIRRVDGKTQRIRRSLGTTDVAVAQLRRDRILAAFRVPLAAVDQRYVG